MRLGDLEARLSENHFQQPVEIGTIDQALTLLVNKEPAAARYVPAPDAFFLESSSRPFDFQFDESLNNVDMLLRYSFLKDKLHSSVEPAMLLPLPSPCSAWQRELLFPAPLCTAAPILNPIASTTALRDFLSSASGLNEAKSTVCSQGAAGADGAPTRAD